MTDQLKLLRHALIGGDNVVEGVCNLSDDADLVAVHPNGKIARSHGTHRREKFRQFMLCAAVYGFGLDVRLKRGGAGVLRSALRNSSGVVFHAQP